MSERNGKLLIGLGVLFVAEISLMIANFVQFYMRLSSDPNVLFTLLNTSLPIEVAMLGATALVDVSIAGVISYLLYQRRSGVIRTDSVIRKLIRYSVVSSGLTGASSILALVFATAYRNTYLLQLSVIIIAKSECIFPYGNMSLANAVTVYLNCMLGL